jgi:hypothetical protein
VGVCHVLLLLLMMMVGMLGLTLLLLGWAFEIGRD